MYGQAYLEWKEATDARIEATALLDEFLAGLTSDQARLVEGIMQGRWKDEDARAAQQNFQMSQLRAAANSQSRGAPAPQLSLGAFDSFGNLLGWRQ